MKTRIIALLLLVGIGAFSGVRAQTYEELWKKVNDACGLDLPKTVVNLSQQIYEKAKAEGNSPQMLAANVWRMRFQEELVPDSFYVNLRQMEQQAEQAAKPLDAAMMHSLLAEAYATYASSNGWTLSRRTEVSPEALDETDVRTWTAEMFVRKVRQHVWQSLAARQELLRAKSDSYAPLIEQGKKSDDYRHDLFHVLGMRGVSIFMTADRIDDNRRMASDIDSLYRVMIDAYRPGEPSAYVATQVEYLQWRHGQHMATLSGKEAVTRADSAYLSALDSLIARYPRQHFIAKAYLAKAQYYMGENLRPKALAMYQLARGQGLKGSAARQLRELAREIRAPQFDVSFPSCVYPGSEVRLQVSHCNLSGLTLRLKQNGEEVMRKHFALEAPANYLPTDTVLAFEAPAVGTYELSVASSLPKDKGSKSYSLYVTRLAALAIPLPGNQLKLVSLDMQSGHPVPHATVSLYKRNAEEPFSTVETDEHGEATVPCDERSRLLDIKIAKGNDTHRPKSDIYNSFNAPTAVKLNQLLLLTDRSVYRPGQTVYVKGIAYSQEKHEFRVQPDRGQTLRLLDPNGIEIARQEVRTNEYGSFAAQFTLPAAGVNGQFRLESDNGSTYFRMEEYKRPTFDIELELPATAYRLGDRVQLTGKVETFGGFSLANLPVKYTVRRRTPFDPSSSNNIVASGETTTDSLGHYTFPVELEPIPGLETRNHWFYVEATATNPAGETKSASRNIMVADRSFNVSTELPANVCTDKPADLLFEVKNQGSKPLHMAGRYALFRVEDEEENRLASEPSFQGDFTAYVSAKADWGGLAPGTYVWKTYLKNAAGEEEENEGRVVLYSAADRRPPVKSPLWVSTNQLEFGKDTPAKFSFGSSEADVYLMVHVFSGNRLLEARHWVLSDSLVTLEYPYSDTYGDGLFVHICLLKNGELHQQDVRMEKKLPERKLTLKWSVFRDKLRPGQEEEWRLTLTKPDGKPADAELLATMYDASLDEIWERDQPFRLYDRLDLPSLYLHYTNGRGYSIWFRPYRPGTVPAELFDCFVDPVRRQLQMLQNTSEQISIADEIGESVGSSRPVALRSAVAAPKEEFYIRGTANNSKKITVTGAVSTVDKADLLSAVVKPEVRTEFGETAFFYPQLRTNERGEVFIAFTLPESLTRWKFNGYAHTKDMMLGTLTDEITASKDVKLTSNQPRFVRTGDRTSFAATVANATGETQEGTVRMELFDPLTDEVIARQEQAFAAAPGQSVGISFEFTADGKRDLLGCRLVADSRAFSDGEQRVLPVLTDKLHLVETLPMPIRGGQTRSFATDDLFGGQSPEATSRRLTVEFTGNPAWYAVQALPSLSQPATSNAMAWAACYYANSVASHIATNQPRIRQVVESWKLPGASGEAFQSNLQKNQELKNILLSESPWVMEARDEQAQKERIVTLFNENNIRNNLSAALGRLSELQNSDGSWSWFEGMRGRWDVTVYVAELLARQSAQTGNKPEQTAKQLNDNALRYLHSEAQKAYKQAVDRDSTYRISGSMLRYLYIVSLTGNPVPQASREAYDYFLAKAAQLPPAASMQAKALAAVVLHRAGQTEKAQALAASLAEHLSQSDERGMFFAFNENPYAWGNMQLNAHVSVMEALDAIGGYDETVEEMKLWLLKEKQTECWNSSVATADAVYALLMKGRDLLSDEGNVCISVGKQSIETRDAEGAAGLDYVKHSYTGKREVNARRIKVEKQGEGVAWGAAYAEYEIPMGEAKQHGGALDVEKQLFVERLVGNKAQLQPLDGETPLRVGDKVVARLRISLDRDMDFVQLKDQRAACFEPTGNLSGYRWNNGLGYYADVKDASDNFFFDHVGKGVYVLEHSYRVDRAGVYQAGVATIQCAYSPEYASHSGSQTVIVEK